MVENKKQKIMKELERVYPTDLSIGEVAKKTGFSRTTVSAYLRILEAEGRIEVSRKVGRAVFYRLKNKGGL